MKLLPEILVANNVLTTTDGSVTTEAFLLFTTLEKFKVGPFPRVLRTITASKMGLNADFKLPILANGTYDVRFTEDGNSIGTFTPSVSAGNFYAVLTNESNYVTEEAEGVSYERDMVITQITVTGVGGSAVVAIDKQYSNEGGIQADIINGYTYSPFSHRNVIINGDCEVDQRTALTLGVANDSIAERDFGIVDRIAGFTTQTASAGILTKDTTLISGLSITGNSIKFSGVTLAAGGKLHYLYRIEAKDAKRFRGRYATFSCNAYHDVGSQQNITIYVRDADVEDVFSATSAIGNNGGQLVSNTIATPLSYTVDFSTHNPERGIEIEIELDCGAITLKDFNIGELQYEVGKVVTPHEYRLTALQECLRYYWRLNSGGDTYMFTSGQVENDLRVFGTVFFPVKMRDAPDLETTGVSADYRVWDVNTGNINCNAGPNVQVATLDWMQLKFSVVSDAGLVAGNAGHLGFSNASSFLGFTAEL